MKRRFLILLCYVLMIMITLSLIAAFYLPFFYWRISEPVSLNVWILDKTVPVPDYREHRGLIWALNHNKVIYQKTNEAFRYDKDYYGFHPINEKEYLINELPNTVERPHLIYLADTYGVYVDDYFTDNIKGTRSDLIYGGLQDNEIDSIKANIGGGNTIIGEFNIGSSPTSQQNKKELEEIFGLRWLGWSGRYFVELAKDVEVPVWTVENYEMQNGRQWDYQGEGFILVSDDDRIIVLEKGKHIGNKGLRVSFEQDYSKEFGIKGEIQYEYWFEYIKPQPGREVLAQYSLDVTKEGEEILANLGLPTVFPSIVRYKNTQYTSYYFAGDFADAKITDKWWNFSGFSKIKSLFPRGTKGDNSKFYWKGYVPIISKIIGDIKVDINLDKEVNKKEDYTKYHFRTSGMDFQISDGDEWKDFFVKGVNIGPTLPGYWFTEFLQDESQYLRWLEMIGEMNANSIRVYTLLPPQFYNALLYYNEKHPETPLWLYQEIWPEEHPPEDDYLKEAYNEEYKREIQYVIDAMHGKANIPKRKYRAFGIYTSNIAPYIAGYLVGRELEPEEVISTDENNKGFKYTGKYLYTEEGASPTEAWLAMNCDYVLEYQEENYNWQHPVGIVSWPTLDYLEHDSEWNIMEDKSLEYNDKTTVNINNISSGDKLKAGFFGAYHIYPNYPDFMNNEELYDNYYDEQGRFRYIGYLREFIQGHIKFPALVAEFGLATGMGNAHENPDGYNHGGLTEEQQGNGIVRMMEAIKREGYTGGLIFEWMDEWAKKTWTTEPYMIPYERHVFWHNMVDPEQNYGILAIESNKQKSETYKLKGNGFISQLSLSADESYLHIHIDLNKEIDFTKEKLVLGLDTYERLKGEFMYSKDIPLPSPTGLEYIIELNSRSDAKLLVHPGYNTTSGLYSSYASSKGIFEEMLRLINKERVTKEGKIIDSFYENESRLRFGVLDDNSYYHWNIDEGKVLLRIPWLRINFTDPSEMRVLDDNRLLENPEKDELKTVTSEGILVSALLISKEDKNRIIDAIGVFELADELVFKWDGWGMPTYKERLKDSYYIIKECFDKLDK